MNPNEIDQSTFILSDRIIAVISVTRTSLEQLTSRQDEDDFHAREAIRVGVMLRGTTGDTRQVNLSVLQLNTCTSAN